MEDVFIGREKERGENLNDHTELDGDTPIDLIISKAINSMYYEADAMLPKKQSKMVTMFPPGGRLKRLRM